MTDTDRYGFPTKVCSRCGGTGRYSYNPIDGDRCYGCNGTKVQYGRKVAAIVAEFREAQKRVHRPTASNLRPGDRASFDHSRGATFRTVVSVTATDDPCGWIGPGDHRNDTGENIPTTWYQIVRWDDGTEERVSGSLIARRKGHVDPAPYVERATR